MMYRVLNNPNFKVLMSDPESALKDELIKVTAEEVYLPEQFIRDCLSEQLTGKSPWLTGDGKPVEIGSWVFDGNLAVVQVTELAIDAGAYATTGWVQVWHDTTHGSSGASTMTGRTDQARLWRFQDLATTDLSDGPRKRFDAEAIGTKLEEEGLAWLGYKETHERIVKGEL